MEELEQEIIAWHESVMPDVTLEVAENKVREELLELCEELIISGSFLHPGSIKEMADVFISFSCLLKKAGLPSLSQTIRDKFTIVQGREYRPDGTRDKGE